MTASFRQALACIASVLAVLFCAPLFAQSAIDGAPFSADPKALLAAAHKIEAKDQNIVYLLDEASITFEANGRTKSVYRVIEYVVTADGVDDAGTATAWWAPWYDDKPVITARVITKDGAVHTLDPKAITEATAEEEQDIFSDQRVLRAPLPGVAGGAVVERVITMEGRSPIAGGGKYGLFLFGSVIPIEHQRLVLDAGAAAAPRVVNKSGFEPHTSEENGRKRIVFEKGHTDAFDDDEDSLPSDELGVPYVAYANGSSWHDIAANYSAIVDEQIAADGDLKSVVASAIGSTTDRAGIIAKLLDVIDKNVRYAGVEVGDGSIVPRPPNSVLQKKYGDCKDKATLLVAMLRTAGLPAHVVLLDAGNGFDTIEDLAGVDHFNHAIVVVDGEQPLWIDPTDEFARPGQLPSQDQGRMALIAADATTALTRTPEVPSAATRYIQTRTFTLPEEGKAHVAEVSEATGSEDAILRRACASSSKKDYLKSLEKSATDYYAAPKLDSYETGEPHDFTKPYRLSLQISKSKSGIVTAGDGDVLVPTYDIVSFLPLELRDYEEKTAEAKAAKPEKKRVHDFVLARPLTQEWRYRIVPAAGFVARTLPQNETTKLGTATLTSEYSLGTDGAVSANFTLDSGKRRLTPAEFEETRAAVSKLAHHAGVHIGFNAIGQAKLNAGDIGAALTEFRKLAVLHPKEAQHHIELARALLAGGLGEAARDEAKRAVALEPSDAKAHAMLATVLEHDLLGRHFRHGCDLPGAVAALRKAKELDPSDAALRARLADLLTYGDDAFKFGRNAHVNESIDEYKSLLKDLGKEAIGYQPPLMLALSYAGRWDEVKELVKNEPDVNQRDLFHLLAVTATEGSAAGVRELGAFDDSKRQNYGRAVGGTMSALRRYSDAADMFEAASKGSAQAAQMLAVVQILRKAQRYDKLVDEPSFKARTLKVMAAILTSDTAALHTLVVPELDDELGSGKNVAFSLRAMTGKGDVSTTIVMDLFAAAVEIQQDGNDDIGYRLRLRSTAGTGAAAAETFYMQRRDGKYLLAAISNSPDTIGRAALKLADAGNIEAARTWLNWARESIAAGGGDDPLAGPPFARLWQKERATASLDEIRLAAAALMTGKSYAKESAPLLASLRETAPSDELKTATDVALATAYAILSDWPKELPVAERLSKAHPDSGLAFTSWVAALAQTEKSTEAETIAKERLARLPKDADAMRAMARIYAKKGDYETAVLWSRRTVDEVTPLTADYNMAAWLALFAGKEFDRAIDDARRGSSDEAQATYGALHTLAALYAESGKSVEARQALLKGMDKRGTDDPGSDDWFVLGRIAENYGVRDVALAAYKRVEKSELTGTSTWELTQRRIAAMPK
jgi:tetratricopeptide (TPR) repeat protein/transglutaminase-like putative cysteine protease